MTEPGPSDQTARTGGFQRKIFYLSGYDPRGARFYHGLHKEQAQLYARQSGHDITVSSRKRIDQGSSVWTIDDPADGATSELEFLGWDEVIRQTWGRNPLKLFWGAITSALSFTFAWEWRRFSRFIPMATFIAFYYPSFSAVVLPALFISLIWLFAGPVLAIVLGLGLSFLVARHLKSLWLLRFVIFNDRFARDEPMPELETRLKEMADRIDAALSEGWDEILLVTHSNGSVLAMPIIAQLLKKHGGKISENFALMTLGSCIPLVSIRRDAKHFRATLEAVAQGKFLWLDLGSRTDGASIPLVDPCLTCETQHRPDLHVLSPRWFKYCDPATYQKRRRNKYETHFEYLRTFERISPLNYLRVTSCGEPLAASIAAFALDPD